MSETGEISSSQDSAGTGTTSQPDSAPDWWHRDHPTFAALSGFFTGMLFVTAVPGGFAGILRLLLPYDAAERFFPWVTLSLLVPLGLLIAPRTRRFGTFMVIGMVLTLLVFLGVTSLVLWFMVTMDA